MTDDRKDEERRTPSWQLPQERQPDTSAYHIWTPRPLLRSIYWKPVPPPPFEVVSASYEVFLEQRAWLTMHEHVWQAPSDRTPFGYLVGDLCEDPNANRKFVIVTSALPARFAFHEERTEQITREAVLALQLEVERRRGVLVGWYHRHIGGEVALSESDVKTHHQHFPEPWQCAFVFTGGGERSDGGCFRSTQTEFAGDLLLPFYEMASNESLLARGTKRSYVDWSNYSTVDEIRSEPLSRPVLPVPPTDEPEAKPVPASAAGRSAPASPPDAGSESTPESARTSPAAPPQAPPRARPNAPKPAPALASESDPARTGGVGPVVESPGPNRAARIEFDPGPRPSTPLVKPREPRPSRPQPDGMLDAVARELETGSRPARSRPVGRWQLPTDRKRLAFLGGAVLLAAIMVGGLLTVTSRDPDPLESPGSGTPAAAAADGGQATSTSRDPAADTIVTTADLERESQEVLRTISQFYGRAVERDDGRATCEQLQAAFVAVEDRWIDYSTRYKARFDGRMPEDLAARDARLYAGVQDTEREFDRSGCPRP